jgi:PAS domain S-box-containing protein
MLSTHYRTTRSPADADLRLLDLLARQAADWVERNHAEEALRDSEARYRSLTAQVKDYAIFSTDPNGKISNCNEGCEHVLGYGQEEFLGLDTAELFSDEDQAGGVLQQALDEGTAHLNRWMNAKDGRRFYAMGAVTCLSDAASRLIGFSFVLRDITEMKRSQDELAHHGEALAYELERTAQRLRLSERMASLGTLSAGLGHDLGNLLLPIDIRLKLLLDADLTAELHDYVVGIEKATQYLQRLASGLRSLAVDPEASLDEAATELRSWWEEAATVFRNVLSRGIKLDAELPENDCRVRMKLVTLTQVVFNLVQNAADALRQRENGFVLVSVVDNPEEAWVYFRVTDNGPGMAPDVVRRCMEPYFSTKPRGISTGMGLSFVHRFVAEVGGQVDIASIVEHGTTVTLTLPRATVRSSV